MRHWHEGLSTVRCEDQHDADGHSEVRQQVSTTEDEILAADEKHEQAQHSQPHEVCHGTTPHKLVEIRKYVGMKDGAVPATKSHTPWCWRGAAVFDAASKNASGRQGCLVQLVVYGQAHSYDTVKELPDSQRLGAEEHWRQVYVEASHGRLIIWSGTFCMKASATEVRGFLIRGETLDAVARVSYAGPRKRS